MATVHRIDSASGSSVEVPEDIDLDVVDRGEPEPACLLIHGFGDNAAVWFDFANRMKTGRRIVMPDLRGHGGSDWSATGSYRTADHLRDISRLADRLALKNIDLIGHSLGAEIGTYFARQNPKKVRRLVLVDFGPEVISETRDKIRDDFANDPRSFANIDAYVRWLSARRPLADLTLLKNLAHRGIRSAPDGSVELVSDPAMGSSQHSPRATVQNGRSIDPELRQAASEINVPVLVVRGSGSSVLPADAAERFARFGLKNGMLKNIQVAGHNVMLDAPEQFFQAVALFLNGD